MSVLRSRVAQFVLQLVYLASQIPNQAGELPPVLGRVHILERGLGVVVEQGQRVSLHLRVLGHAGNGAPHVLQAEAVGPIGCSQYEHFRRSHLHNAI